MIIFTYFSLFLVATMGNVHQSELVGVVKSRVKYEGGRSNLHD